MRAVASIQVLELHSLEESHFGGQARPLCDMIPTFPAIVLQAGGEACETRSAELVEAVLRLPE